MASMVSSCVHYCSSESCANDRRFKSVPPRIVCKHHSPSPYQNHNMPSDSFHRRELLLRTSELAVLAAILNLSYYISYEHLRQNEIRNLQNGKKPDYLGVQKNQPALALCPATRNCISTSEDVADLTHYAPPWNYNPEEGRGRKNPVSREVAIRELLQVIKSTKPDNFTPKIVEQKDDYVRVEYESPVLGFVDDVEFWFPPGKKSIVEYRSASRLGNFDFDVNRKRIKAIRLALEKKGWASAADT